MENTVQEYIKKLEHYYDTDGKLLQYPSKKPMRIIALIKIAEKIDISRKYTEKEMNEIIRSSIAFGDIELIRREMFQYKLIRETEGRIGILGGERLETDLRRVYECFVKQVNLQIARQFNQINGRDDKCRKYYGRYLLPFLQAWEPDWGQALPV